MAKKKPLTTNTIDTTKAGMLKRPRNNSKKGKDTGMSFSNYLHGIFRVNQKLQKSKKLTDAAIARNVRKEFAGHKAIVERFDEKNENLASVICKYRSEYNRGRLMRGSAPPTREFVSFQFNEDGQEVNALYATPKPYTLKEIAAVKDRYAVYREEYEKRKKA